MSPKTPTKGETIKLLANIKKRRAANPSTEEISEALTAGTAHGMDVAELAHRSGVHRKQLYRSYRTEIGLTDG